MCTEREVRAADARFFDSLRQRDPETLDGVLGPDFLLIDVMTGSEIPRPVFLDLVGSGQLVFESVQQVDARVRCYDRTAVVTGETRMRGQYGGQPFGSHSRYTHVYLRDWDGWRLVTAQGTPVAVEA